MNVAEVMNVIGDVDGRTCLIIDDLKIRYAGTLVKTAQALKDNGAIEVYACASHAVLSGPAVENIPQSVIKEVVVTNTIPLNPEADAARTEREAIDSRPLDCRTDWPRDPGQSRRDFGQVASFT